MSLHIIEGGKSNKDKKSQEKISSDKVRPLSPAEVLDYKLRELSKQIEELQIAQKVLTERLLKLANLILPKPPGPQ